jgi:hypothetical protein
VIASNQRCESKLLVAASVSNTFCSAIQQQKKEGFKQSDCQHWEQTEKGHGRLEKRVYGLCTSVDWLRDRHPHWVNLNAIVWVDSCVVSINKRAERLVIM